MQSLSKEKMKFVFLITKLFNIELENKIEHMKTDHERIIEFENKVKHLEIKIIELENKIEHYLFLHDDDYI